MEIALRRGRYDAVAALSLVAALAVLLGLAAAARELLDGGPRVAALVGLLLLGGAWSAAYVAGWCRVRRVEHPLALHDYGVFSRSHLGEVSAPWHAVRSAEVERTWSGPLLRIRLAPPTDPAHADVVVASPQRGLPDRVDRHGLRLSLRALDVDLEDLRAAFATRSGGRVRLT